MYGSCCLMARLMTSSHSSHTEGRRCARWDVIVMTSHYTWKLQGMDCWGLYVPWRRTHLVIHSMQIKMVSMPFIVLCGVITQMLYATWHVHILNCWVGGLKMVITHPTRMLYYTTNKTAYKYYVRCKLSLFHSFTSNKQTPTTSLHMTEWNV